MRTPPHFASLHPFPFTWLFSAGSMFFTVALVFHSVEWYQKLRSTPLSYGITCVSEVPSYLFLNTLLYWYVPSRLIPRNTSPITLCLPLASKNMKRQRNQRCRFSFPWFKENYSRAVKSGLNMQDSILFSNACGKRKCLTKTSIKNPNFQVFSNNI